MLVFLAPVLQVAAVLVTGWIGVGSLVSINNNKKGV